jgi:hypothetical protein
LKIAGLMKNLPDVLPWSDDRGSSALHLASSACAVQSSRISQSDKCRLRSEGLDEVLQSLELECRSMSGVRLSHVLSYQYQFVHPAVRGVNLLQLRCAREQIRMTVS